MTNIEQQQEALTNATQRQSMANYPAIFEGFAAKGIAMADIKPRENVFTFNAWKALGRSVKKGEHGVKVVTFIQATSRDTSESGEESVRSWRTPRTTTVFHISQTEPTGDRAAQSYKPRDTSTYDRTIKRTPDHAKPSQDRWNETH
jgi:hypothetical protein